MAADIKTIQETSDYVVASGKKKLAKKPHVLLLQGFLAGVFIALGAIGYFKVAALALDPGVGIFLASAIFPMGIIAIIMLDAELFTSNTMMVMGFYNRQYSLLKVLKILAFVWIANFIGMVFISWLTAGERHFQRGHDTQNHSYGADKNGHADISAAFQRSAVQFNRLHRGMDCIRHEQRCGKASDTLVHNNYICTQRHRAYYCKHVLSVHIISAGCRHHDSRDRI